MPQLLSQEFCRITKLHLDEILSQSAGATDLRLIIESMMQTIEFEGDLHRRYPPLDENGEEVKGGASAAAEKNQIGFKDGKVEVAASGDASDIRAKY